MCACAVSDVQGMATGFTWLPPNRIPAFGILPIRIGTSPVWRGCGCGCGFGWAGVVWVLVLKVASVDTSRVHTDRTCIEATNTLSCDDISDAACVRVGVCGCAMLLLLLLLLRRRLLFVVLLVGALLPARPYH